MNTTHTPEPWFEQVKVIEGLENQEAYREVYAGNGFYDDITKQGFSLTGYMSPNDAARIVACVNACAGLTNEEVVKIGKYLGKEGRTYYTLVADMREAQAQRDTLLEAIKSHLDLYNAGLLTDPQKLEEHTLKLAEIYTNIINS
jgi:hypothetical protein